MHNLRRNIVFGFVSYICQVRKCMVPTAHEIDAMIFQGATLKVGETLVWFNEGLPGELSSVEYREESKVYAYTFRDLPVHVIKRPL